MGEAPSATPLGELQRLLGQPAAMAALTSGVAALLLGIVARRVQPDPVNVPLVAADGRLFYLLVTLAAIGAGFVVQRVVAPGERAGGRNWINRYLLGSELSHAGLLPGVTVLAVALLAVRHQRGMDLIALTLLAVSAVHAAVTVREHLWSDDARSAGLARQAQVGLTVATGFVAFNAVLQYRARTLWTAPVVFLLALLLLLQAHDGVPAFAIRRFAYAVLGALALAQATWGLAYWPPAGWYAGGVLAAALLGFVLVNGAQLSGRLTRSAVAQGGGLAAALFLACAWLAG